VNFDDWNFAHTFIAPDAPGASKTAPHTPGFATPRGGISSKFVNRERLLRGKKDE
jgi:hypothetical protein